MASVGDSETAQVWVAASPTVVYDLVSDPTQMANWSPEVVRVVVLDEEGPAQVGMGFRGTSRARLRWSRTCEVIAAQRPTRFTFRTVPTWMFSDSTVWAFEIRPHEGGSLVTQRYEVVRGLRLPLRWVVRLNGRPHRLAPHLQRTLLGLKHSAEQAQDSAAASKPKEQ
jgi:uncharacterized protein YndB with AHSA1/START domain